ncbi:MAG: hypothetical protein ACRC1H_00750, partial [Caldilineaceae bacterium]
MSQRSPFPPPASRPPDGPSAQGQSVQGQYTQPAYPGAPWPPANAPAPQAASRSAVIDPGVYQNVRDLNARIEQEAAFLQQLLGEVNRVMVGQEPLIRRVLIALLADGHLLLEG